MTYKEVYLNHFGFDKCDTIYCEVCGAVAVDIHHIKCRGMGGSKERDNIENLMALCRICHEKYGDKRRFYDYLNYIHLKIL